MEGFASISAATQEADNENELIGTCKELWRSAEREIATWKRLELLLGAMGDPNPYYLGLIVNRTLFVFCRLVKPGAQ